MLREADAVAGRARALFASNTCRMMHRGEENENERKKSDASGRMTNSGWKSSGFTQLGRVVETDSAGPAHEKDIRKRLKNYCENTGIQKIGSDYAHKLYSST